MIISHMRTWKVEKGEEGHWVGFAQLASMDDLPKTSPPYTKYLECASPSLMHIRLGSRIRLSPVYVLL